jgi:type IV secretion system protein TrbI
LPGDLGRPILNAGAAANTTGPPIGLEAEAQHIAQEAEAARVSRLLAHTNQPPQPVGIVARAVTTIQAGPTPPPPVEAGAAEKMQDRKTAFVPAALITGIRSDLPGRITAQVTEAVHHSPTGKYLLIPQDAKLIGQYDSSLVFGQGSQPLVICPEPL